MVNGEALNTTNPFPREHVRGYTALVKKKGEGINCKIVLLD